MAEIKIEKKKSIWPWVLLGLLALILIWFFFMKDKNNKEVVDNKKTEQAVVKEDQNVKRASAIAMYSDYISDTSKMGVDHEYSSGALNHLINAVEEKAKMHDVDINADLTEARKDASEITKDPAKLNHADLIKKSGKIITRALTTLQKSKFPSLSSDLANVDKSVNAIDPAKATLDQKDVVNNFFKSAETLLLKMK